MSLDTELEGDMTNPYWRNVQTPGAAGNFASNTNSLSKIKNAQDGSLRNVGDKSEGNSDGESFL